MTRRKGGEQEKVSEVPTKNGHDPLRWFGVLVPPTLRQSSECFKRAAEIAVECANLQNEMRGVEDRRKFLGRKLKKGDGGTEEQ